MKKMTNSSKIRIVTTLALLTMAATSLAQTFVWWEGENTLENNFPKTTWFAPNSQAEKELLSGGQWLTNNDKRTGEEAFAIYSVDLPADGQYGFWTRKFWKHGPFKWRFDSEEWQICGKDIALADNTTLRTHVTASWVFLDNISLKKGTHKFELRLLAKEGENLTACFDCFILSQTPFEPNGKMKPGQKSGEADDGFFAWEPSVDPFSKEALLDLRYLNETTAGQDGHIVHNGNDFNLGNGKPVRFWGANVSANNAGQDRASIDFMARKLAKLGVNMVRFHSAMFDKSGDPALVDKKKLDNLHYLISAMKREGIYTKISFYFPIWFNIKAGYGIDGFESNKNKVPFSLLYFNPRMQEIYKSWAKAIITTTNPYTGEAVAIDPAVAIVEIINEDSFFFWTFSKGNIPPQRWKHLEGLYNIWLDKEQPQGKPHKRQLYEAWHMTRDGIKKTGGRNKQSIMDQIRFLTEHQRGFYEAITRYFKDDLGYQGLVSASNWHTADDVQLGALERYTYTAGDVIDRHGYFGGTHKGDGASYSVRKGHTYKDRSGLLNPETLPIQVNQVAGYPHIISEVGWPNPNRYKAESTALGSAYAALQGIDGLFWFAVGNNSLTDKSLSKFAVGVPSIGAMFPAMALQYRRGDIKEAKPVVFNQYTLTDLYALKGGAAAAQALDQLRKNDSAQEGENKGAQGIDPLLFYVGGVYQSFSDTKGGRQTRDQTNIDHNNKRVRSSTGELNLDYGKGLMVVNTPRSKGITGFCSKVGETRIGNVSIQCSNNYASITLIALDEKPIEKSNKILIQAMTYDQPFGFQTKNGHISSLGLSPFGIELIKAQISVRFSTPAKASLIALDENGYPTEKRVDFTQSERLLKVDLRNDTVYHIIER